jgi:hypothetical protein
MKTIKILLLTISLISIFGCTKDDSENFFSQSENYRLTKVLNYSNSTDSEPSTFMDLKYSEDGNLQRESLYDYPNTLFTFREYDYENNLLVEKRIFDGQVGNLRLGTYTKYEYADGNLVKEELYLADGTLKRTEYFEYEGKNLLNTYKVDDKLGIHHQYKYTYNDLNLLVREEKFMYNQELDGFTKYNYDDNLRLIRTEIFNFDETIIQTIEHKYTGDNTLPSEEFYYDSDSELIQQKQLIYDNFDNLTEAKVIDNQGTHILFRKKYNGKLLIEHIRYAPTWGYTEWTVTRYEYEKIK